MIDGKPARAGEPVKLAPGLRRATWEVRYRGGFTHRAGATVVDSVFIAEQEEIPLGERWCPRFKFDLEAYLAVPREKIRVIPNGVSARFRPTEDEESTTRIVTGLGVHRPYLLFVGNPKPHKNLSFLLEVFARLAPTTPALSLVLVGAATPALRSQLGDRAARAGLGGRVTLLGHLPSDPLVALYQGALALVFPSRYEGFGLPALEAMACGAPVVASAAGALPEVIGEAGWLLPPDDHDAWITALRALWDDVPLRDKLRAKGLERAQAYPWRRTAVATEAVYEEAGRRPGV